MSGQALERELQHDLRRARGPAALTLGYFKPFQKTAYVDKQAGKFRTYRIKCVMQALPSCNDAIRQEACLMTA